MYVMQLEMWEKQKTDNTEHFTRGYGGRNTPARKLL